MIENFIVHMRGRVVFDMECGDTYTRKGYAVVVRG